MKKTVYKIVRGQRGHVDHRTGALEGTGKAGRPLDQGRLFEAVRGEGREAAETQGPGATFQTEGSGNRK